VAGAPDPAEGVADGWRRFVANPFRVANGVGGSVTQGCAARPWAELDHACGVRALADNFGTPVAPFVHFTEYLPQCSIIVILCSIVIFKIEHYPSFQFDARIGLVQGNARAVPMLPKLFPTNPVFFQPHRRHGLIRLILGDPDVAT
jgi:hypothetical protein